METLYTPEQAAEILQVHVKTVQGWIRAGKLKAVRAGRFWRVKESDLEAYLVPASGETAPKEQTR
jgi:excisionase family DNA binding protein